MQIIIVQTEIEEAIRNHILGQITVKEGQRIDIDLKATRGAEGYQAIIDIVPEGSARKAPAHREEQAEVQPEVETAVVKPTPVKAAKATAVKATTKASKAKADPAPPADPVVEPEVEQAQAETKVEAEPEAEADDSPLPDAPIEEGDQTVADIAAEAPAEEAVSAAPRTSLFANLKTPSNA